VGEKERRHRPFLRGASTLSVKILAYGCGVIVSVLVARALGPQERGVWSLALSIAALFAMAGDLGISTSALYLMRQRPDRIRCVVVMGASLALGGSLLLGLIVLACRRLGSAWLSGMPESVLVIVALLVPLIALVGLTRQLLTALDDLIGANGSLVVQSVLLPVALVATFLTRPSVAKWALGAYVATMAATLLASAVRLWPRVPPGPFWDTSLLGPLFRVGLVSQLASLALVVTYRSDLLLVGHWLGLGAAGVYSVGLTLSEVLRGVPETAQTLVVSRALREDLAAYAEATARATVLLTAAAGILFVLAAPVVVPLVFGRSFADAALVLACLGPGVVGLALSYAISPLLFLEGRVAISAYAGSCAAVVLWAFSVLTPFEVSLAKVALASSLAYWTLAGIQIAYLVRRGRIDPRALVPRPGEVVGMVRALAARAGA
jgi:O-antigen/teichoic acid export membrane protein